MAYLGVNIDHVATLRQARGTQYPDPIEAAVLAQLAGADQITVHLREDRRHIVDRDVRLLRSVLQVPLNLEMACTDEMLKIALEVKPDMVTLVPEKRQERTTEGGLDLTSQADNLRSGVATLRQANIPCSLFVEPEKSAVEATLAMGATMVEFHTGKYCELSGQEQTLELERLRVATAHAHARGIVAHSGHGLNYRNVIPVASIPHMHDLNIGHSIVARAVLVGLERAVREMKELICLK